ncbi:MAG: transglycosylase SLT domain-containing protein [Treponema sp.]|nr:transglycosylase SLT domain-containing protein [Treponema sp.]MEE3434428.1 transglycosylase SLT domain-containing protein [Treponema sp.]
MLSSAKKTILALAFFSLFTACSQEKVSLNKFYGADASYFNGLLALRDKDTETAQKYFFRSAKKGSYWAARRSMRQLCLIGDVQQRIKRCQDYLKKYNDDDAKLFAAREFLADKEWALAIEATDDIDLAVCDNSLAALRLQALDKKNDSRFDQTVYDWFTQRRISDVHYEFYKQNARDELEDVITGDVGGAEQFSDFAVNKDFVLQFRIAIYRGNYNAAFEMYDQIRALTIEKNKIPLTWQLVADMGRACVNGNNDDINNAKWFEELARGVWKDKRINYYAMIYSGLLYNKNDNYRRRSLKQFEAALDLAGDEGERDQALWYYLQSCLKISTEEALAGLKKHAASFCQKDYFDDFFDSLSVLLFSGGKWNLFRQVLDAINGHASQATVSKYAYLTARVLQSQTKEPDKEKIEQAYKLAAATDPGTYVYYKLLAAKELGYSAGDIDKMFFEPKNIPPLEPEKVSMEQALSARKLLLGYADFGLGECIYDEWKFFFDMDKKMIDLPTVERLSEFLRQMAGGQNDYYSKSLRMIARSANLDGVQISRAAFELLYPQNFLDCIRASAKEFEVDDYLMFALIRTESFFEPAIQSHAGAIGLTQLMESTASDCAKRLKVESYNLLDPATNIRFGTYYYSHMKKRLDDSGILALFAYNAGITVVRRWIRSSKIELNSQGQLWSDMFLETLPFAETRDYGRRVVSAAAIYAWLYDGKNPCDIVSELM